MADWAKELERDLDWRMAELVSFKALISSADTGTVRHTALLRAAWALLYAHYEGFCKFAWDLYLEALEKEKKSRLSYKDKIVCFSLEKDFKKLKGNLASDNLWSFCVDEFPKLLSEPVMFMTKLETEANLWPEVFTKNSEKVSLPTQMINIHNSKIRALVARRNDIAHGKKMIIKELAEYQEYEKAVISVINELAEGIIESLENKKYLRP